MPDKTIAVAKIAGPGLNVIWRSRLNTLVVLFKLQIFSWSPDRTKFNALFTNSIFHIFD